MDYVPIIDIYQILWRFGSFYFDNPCFSTHLLTITFNTSYWINEFYLSYHSKFFYDFFKQHQSKENFIIYINFPHPDFMRGLLIWIYVGKTDQIEKDILKNYQKVNENFQFLNFYKPKYLEFIINNIYNKFISKR
jgi:hypothetical protein